MRKYVPPLYNKSAEFFVPPRLRRYVGELREFREFLHARTTDDELKELNLLGVQFALCEASKYFFYLKYESGPIYKPKAEKSELKLREVDAAEMKRLRSIWTYWEGAGHEEVVPAQEEELHPDCGVAE